MRQPAPERRLVVVLLVLGLGWLLFFQPIPKWSGSLEISSARIAVSLHSENVRFRTGLFGNGHSAVLSIATGRA